MTGNSANALTQDAAAAAYRHAADMAAAIAAKSRNQQLTAGSGPVFVRVERVEHLAAELAARAEEARRTEGVAK